MATVQGSGTQADPWTRWIGGAWEFWNAVVDGNTYYARVGAYFEITDYEPMSTDYWVDDVDPDGTYGLAYDGNYGLQGTCTSVGRVEIKLCAFNEDEEIDDATWIYIQILPAPTYTHTIAYNANGGSGSMSSTMVTDTNSGNTNVTFASNGFTRANYNFTGWKINNTGTLYQPGNTYAVAGNSSVTAYAQWTSAIATTNVKVNGVWTQGSVYVKVNGAWVESKKIYVKVNGNWVEGS